ncbi:uncharacterized protein LACBIDRAFT_322485 [Laccaria bicolor S238N-H82]|uniref:Predicted protein n=1 Tax=Laccaria bicolor (strain S238N-H82 / ATCC MYA-4686) TaxID=486041 RepID=B0CWG5_LACBS|nr:uncharacterized protein LACBIDRAFT_322485 [Laccaria bicolor S238N-H82]EDR13504.1 predicted protein [Laccaria bicolor S238N-H82]|eukprot:XP_001876002.1 predicted protein [Laccaria bicolor S238N-H82]
MERSNLLTWDLNIPASYFTDWRGVKSIMLGTLLQAIVSQSQLGHVAQTSVHLLTFLSGASVSVDVATTRVPVFDSAIQSPEYGFRVLHSLRSTDFQAMHHTGASIDIANEILALDPLHTLLAAYGRVWAPFDIYLPHHFIIVFMVPSSAQFPAIFPAPSTQTAQIGSQNLLGYHSSHVPHMDHPSTEFSSSLLSLTSESYSHSPSPIPSIDFATSGPQASPSFSLDFEMTQFLAEDSTAGNQYLSLLHRFLLDSYWTPGFLLDSYWILTFFPEKHFHICLNSPSYWTPTELLLDSYWTPIELKQIHMFTIDTNLFKDLHDTCDTIKWHTDFCMPLGKQSQRLRILIQSWKVVTTSVSQILQRIAGIAGVMQIFEKVGVNEVACNNETTLWADSHFGWKAAQQWPHSELLSTDQFTQC